MVLLENWLNWHPKPIIFNRDFPRDSTIVPKHIKKEVTLQLKNKLHFLPQWTQHFVIILRAYPKNRWHSPIQFECGLYLPREKLPGSQL